MKIALTPPKAIADNKAVKIGDMAPSFQIAPTPPKSVSEKKRG